jgi:hypothetical protein
MPEPSQFDGTDAARLGRVIALGSRHDGAPHWTSDEIAAIYRHELTAPLHIELGAVDTATARRLKLVSASHGLLLRSMGELLHHPNPPVELLVMVKDFGKASLDHPDSPLPREVAGALYWSAIAAALVRAGQRITSLPDGKLREGFRWTAQFAWLDDASRALLRQATARLNSAGGGEPQ